MDSLNSKNQSETGTSVFSKHKFDRAEPDGSILIPESKGLFFRKSKSSRENDTTGSMIAARGETADGLDPETRRKRKMIRIAGIAGASFAAILAIVIVVVLVVAPRPEKPKEIANTGLTMEEAFNNYANLLLTGDTSENMTDEQVKETFASRNAFNNAAYANKLINDTNFEGLIQYVDDLNNSYNSFFDLYDGELSDEQLRFLPAFYYNYARGKYFSEENIRNRFLEKNSEEETRNYIREFVNPNIDRYSASRYLGLKYKYLIDYVDVLIEARDGKCSIDGYGEGPACAVGDTYDKYVGDKAIFETESAKLEMSAQDDALYTFASLYNDLVDDFITGKTTAEAKI